MPFNVIKRWITRHVARNLFPSRCWATVALEFLPAREHGYLRSGHITEAMSPVEVLSASLSLHFTMGPLKWVILDSFLSWERGLEARLAIGACTIVQIRAYNFLIRIYFSFWFAIFWHYSWNVLEIPSRCFIRSKLILMYQHSYTSLLRNFVSFQIAIRGLKIRVSDLLANLRLTMFGAVVARFQMKIWLALSS